LYSHYFPRKPNENFGLLYCHLKNGKIIPYGILEEGISAILEKYLLNTKIFWKSLIPGKETQSA
jgi:hypothetical protein